MGNWSRQEVIDLIDHVRAVAPSASLIDSASKLIEAGNRLSSINDPSADKILGLAADLLEITSESEDRDEFREYLDKADNARMTIAFCLIALPWHMVSRATEENDDDPSGMAAIAIMRSFLIIQALDMAFSYEKQEARVLQFMATSGASTHGSRERVLGFVEKTSNDSRFMADIYAPAVKMLYALVAGKSSANAIVGFAHESMGTIFANYWAGYPQKAFQLLNRYKEAFGLN